MPKRYCSHCGAKMIEEKIGAETAIVFGEFGSMSFAAAFNDKTGKRQYVKQFICPAWKITSWRDIFKWCKHDKYFIDEIIN